MHLALHVHKMNQADGFHMFPNFACAHILFTRHYYLYSELDELSNIWSFNVEGFCASWVELEGW